MDSELHSCNHPPHKPLYGAVPQSWCAQERHQIHLWISFWGGGSPTTSPLLLSCQWHAMFDGGPTETLLLVPHHSKGTKPLVAGGHNMWSPTLSSVACTLPPNGSPPRGRCGSASRQSYQRFSRSPQFWKTRWGCQTIPATIMVTLMQPGRHQHKKKSVQYITSLTHLSCPPTPPVTNKKKWHTTASTTTLKMLGGRGSHLVPPPKTLLWCPILFPHVSHHPKPIPVCDK